MYLLSGRREYPKVKQIYQSDIRFTSNNVIAGETERGSLCFITIHNVISDMYLLTHMSTY